jgi:S-DNA-T family DNA segregation ATPase FtsK/SpoIIIE
MARKAKKPKNPPPVAQWITKETQGMCIFCAALIVFLSISSFALTPNSSNILGFMGHTIGWIFHALFGLSSYLLAIYIGWIGWRLLFSKSLHFIWLKHLYVAIAVFSMSMLLSVIENEAPHLTSLLRKTFYPGSINDRFFYHLGGAPFFYFYRDLPSWNLNHMFNTVGVILIFSSSFFASLLFLFKIRLIDLYQSLLSLLKKAIERHAYSPLPSNPIPVPVFSEVATDNHKKQAEKSESDFLRFVKLRIPNSLQDQSLKTSSPSSDFLAIQPEKNPTIRPSMSRKEQSLEDSFSENMASKKGLEQAELRKENITDKNRRTDILSPSPSIPQGDFASYTIPIPSLLTSAKKIDQSSLKKDLKKQAEVLEETLLSFGIEAKVGQINCGPTITSFEVHPAIGVKVQKIKTLDNDIALNMEAKSIRIIAPIPGKAAVGIEVPNSQPQEVGFKDMLLAYQQSSQKFHIPILLGKAVNGDYVMSDLAKMPHCIIAGATGSGKSVCINTIVMSILLNAKPDEIKLLMIDPKKVELTPYTRLPHMLAPVITEPQGAAAALNWLVKEMEKRYEMLKLVGVRNIEAFNKRTIQPTENALEREIPTFIPYIVGIIDELADLMMVASQDIETPIARIAQMARAVGIHLILATQRPSREVITGLIKANFPTRISFKVASRVNSQIVLDETGAETLLGNGDMLFLPPGSSHLIRAQGAFIRDEDIQSVIDNICQQAPTQYMIQSFDRLHEFNENHASQSSDLDSLYEQAKEVILSTGNASTTFLQRKLKIGYARAASLMDQLEKNGIVGPIEGSKPRKIFAKKSIESEIDADVEI